MVCRLCLMNLQTENAIALFETSGSHSETQTLKIIAKHFHLELSPDDPISTSICPNCSEHLEDFHRFWVYVDQKQGTLRNEFLEVKCEVNILSEGNEESLLDLKNISVEFAEAVPVEEFGCANKIDANNVDEVDTAAIDALNDSASDSADDNTSLQTLITRSKAKTATNSKVSKRKNKKRKVSKVKLKNDTDEGEAEEEDSESESNSRKLQKKAYDEAIANFMKLSCDLCNWPLGNFNELRNHFRTLHQCSAYVKCCGRSFSQPSVLVDHIKWHENPNMHTCDICQKRYRSERSLQLHKEKHLTNDELNLSCRLCNISFVNQESLKEHVVTHENDKDNICEICDKSFLTAKRLRLHVNSIHRDVSHVCDTCGQNFKLKRAFKKHILEHQGIVEPPAQCEECGEWLKNKKSLSNHRSKHDQINVDCHICGRKCPSRKALKKHMDYMHKRKNNLQCNFCEKTFKLPRCLEEHIATHTGALLYSCPHCSIEFRSKSNMYVHIKRIHMEEWLQSKVARSNDPNIKSHLD